MKKRLCCIVLIAACLLMMYITPVYAEIPLDDTGVKIEDYADKVIGVQTGTSSEFSIKEILPDATYLDFRDYNSVALALQSGQVDAIALDEVTGEKLLKGYENARAVAEPLSEKEIAALFPKTEKGYALCDEFNEYLARLKSDGTIDDMLDIWFRKGREAERVPIDLNTLTGERGTLKYVVDLTQEPTSYYNGDNLPLGFEFNLVAGFCEEYGYRVEYMDQPFESLLLSIATGVGDICTSYIAIIEERKEKVLFSEPYKDAYTRVYFLTGNDAGDTGSLKDSFYKTFIRESRWKLIVHGIFTTVIITIASIIVGSVLGFGICKLRISNNSVAVIAAKIYIKIFQGTPVLVVLMIFYYLVFNKSGLPAVVVAIVTFGMNSAAYLCEVYRSGIEAVDPGQREAALALGFTEKKSFYTFVLPQAVTHFMPVYRGECISLLKSTSIVGYVAIQDLTKVGDIIRSRTFEALFPLLSIAVVYFILSYLLGLLLITVEKRINS